MIVPIGLALIVYELVSVLTLIADGDRAHRSSIDSLRACVRVDIDS